MKMTRFMIARGLLLVFIILSSGCATIISSETQSVTMRSEPTGAKVLIDGVIEGKTPMIVELKRKKRHAIQFTHQGQTVQRATTRGFNWWYLGNIIFGGLVGLIIDPVTGAMYEVEPEAIYVDFNAPEIEPVVAAPAPAVT